MFAQFYHHSKIHTIKFKSSLIINPQQDKKGAATKHITKELTMKLNKTHSAQSCSIRTISSKVPLIF